MQFNADSPPPGRRGIQLHYTFNSPSGKGLLLRELLHLVALALKAVVSALLAQLKEGNLFRGIVHNHQRVLLGKAAHGERQGLVLSGSRLSLR